MAFVWSVLIIPMLSRVNAEGWTDWEMHANALDGTVYTLESSRSNDLITEICVRDKGTAEGQEESYVKGIKATFASGETTGWIGGSDSAAVDECFTLNAGECIDDIYTRSGTIIDGLQFTTSDGNVYGPYGNLNGGKAFPLAAEDGECLLKLEVQTESWKDDGEWLSKMRYYFGALPAAASDNILCDTDSWNEIKGSWTFDDSDCSLENTDSDEGNIVWFGSADGLTPDDNFDDESFTMSVTMSIHSGTKGAGVLFRAGTVSTVNNGGQQYYLGLYPEENKIKFVTVDDGWSTKKEASNLGLTLNGVYTLSIQALGDSYTIYLDGEVVFSDIARTDYGSGSIGLRTYRAPTTYYSLSYESTAASGSVSPCDYESDGDISVQFGGAAKVSASPQCEWYLGTDAKMVDDWALGLKLSRDYQFGDGISSVSVEFEGECVTSECDMFWGFGDGQKWLTVFHDFESDGGANAKADGVQNGFWVYPPCGGPLADGDIESVLAGSTSSGDYPWNVVRDQLAAGDRTDWHYLSSNLNGDTWPVTVEVTNFVGDDESIFHFISDSLNEECHFTEAFLDGTDLFVAIQPDLQNGTHDDIRVHSLSVDTNVIPTPHPTRSPTDSPTGAPSESPSRAPTDTPTLAPSSAPSESPSPSPTDAPSKAPTFSPTESPTNSPTSVCEGHVADCRAEYATICDTYFSAPSITSFGVTVGTTSNANTDGTVSVSLWHSGSFYQCSFDGMSKGTTYSCSSATWTESGTACDSSSADYKLVVDNPDKDAVDIDSVFLTVDGVEYSYDAWCTSDEWKPFNHDIEYSPSSCPDGYVNYDKICLDTDQCDTTTAMFHFELTNPGQTAYDALMEDAADICIVPNGCECPTDYSAQQIVSNPVIPMMNVEALDTGSWSMELSVRDLLFAMSVFVNVLFVAICFFKRMAGGSGKYEIVRFDSETELEAL